MDDLKFWASSMLLFIGIGVAATIVMHIILSIVLSIGKAIRQTIETGKTDDKAIERSLQLDMVEDEMDKLISLKLQGLRDAGGIKLGDKVLIYGAGGGVGTFAVQLAKYLGAEVTALCGEKNARVMQSLGADHVIPYNGLDVTKISGRYDLVLAVNGSNRLKVYLRLLSPGGTLVMVGGSLKQVMKALLLGRFYSLGSKKVRSLSAKPSAEDLAYIVKLVEEGRIKPVIDRTYPLAQTAQAVRYQSEGHAMGKVMIRVREEKPGEDEGIGMQA